MARGWESKSVEEQQAEHSGSAASAKPPRDPAEIALARQRDDLKLRRRHILQQLEVVQSSRHRQLLQGTLSYLDDQISVLDQTS
jgi:hypothetical protein